MSPTLSSGTSINNPNNEAVINDMSETTSRTFPNINLLPARANESRHLNSLKGTHSCSYYEILTKLFKACADYISVLLNHFSIIK
jgi:hypothetical protein